MAAPTFVNAGAIAHNTVGVTVGAPANLATNDIELLVCESMDEAISLATANGFVEVTGSPISVPNATATIATRGALFWRRYSGQGDPVTNDPGNHIIAQRYAFRGCPTTGDPWDFIQTSSEATEDTSGSATGNSTAGADRLIAIIVGSSKPDSLGVTELSGFTNAALTGIAERADNAGNSGNGGHVGLATGVKATSGATGATTYTKATSAFKWHFVVALKPGGTATTMTADAGTFTLTGQTAGLKGVLKTPLSAGTFTMTGQSAGLARGIRMPAGAGTFTMTGMNTSVSAAMKLSAAHGVYSLTGQAANLKTGRVMQAETGVFQLTGMDADVSDEGGGGHSSKRAACCCQRKNQVRRVWR